MRRQIRVPAVVNVAWMFADQAADNLITLDVVDRLQLAVEAKRDVVGRLLWPACARWVEIGVIPGHDLNPRAVPARRLVMREDDHIDPV